MWLATAANGSLWIRFEFDRVYQLHELLVWNHNGEFEKFLGFGLKNVTIEHSTDGTQWTVFGPATFNQATANAQYSSCTIVPLDGVAAKYVRFNVVSVYGTSGSCGLSEVRFTYVPTYAREPQPAPGATNVPLDTVLRWRAGREAVSHEVYLSTDQQAVLTGTAPAAKTGTTSHDPSLAMDRTYYWKVNEIDPARIPSVWPGSVWSFSTPPYLVVEDFEAYTEAEGNRIYETWLDGFGTTTNGSQAGYADAPFAERTTIHGGKQSLPFIYDNTAAALSEATRTFDSGQDWTGWGAKTLVVFFYGDLGNTAGRLYLKINNQKVVHPEAAALSRPTWQQWNVDLPSLANVTKLTIGVEGAGAKGMIFVDDIRLYASAPAVKEQIWIEAEAATTLTAPLEVAANKPDASGGKYIGSVDAGLSRSSGPGTDGTGLATYKFTVQGGVYTIRVREIISSGQADSWWVRIQGETLNVKTHASGWIQWNGVPVSQNWAWNTIYSSDDGGKTVLFTLPAGTYTLEMAYREDGCLLDALVIAAQ